MSLLLKPRETWGPFIQFTWVGVVWLAIMEAGLVILLAELLERVVR